MMSPFTLLLCAQSTPSGLMKDRIIDSVSCLHSHILEKPTTGEDGDSSCRKLWVGF